MKTLVFRTKPISVNRLYGNANGRKFLSKEGRSVKEQMAWEAKSQWSDGVVDGEVAVNVIFYFERNTQDIDNCLKALFDCLEGIIWKNDRLVTEMHVFKELDKENPRIELQVLQ